MSFLKEADTKFVIAGLGTLAVFGSFVIAAIVWNVLVGLGMNEDLAWGLTMVVWFAAVAVSILGVISFYNSIKNRVEQVTVIREVVAPPVPVIPAPVESRPFLDAPEHPTAPSASYRSMLSKEDNTVEPETQPLSDEPERPATPPGNFRSMLLEEGKRDDQLR